MVGRVEGKGLATGVYEELVGRWWAVYDKHYRAVCCVSFVWTWCCLLLMNADRRVRKVRGRV